MSGTDEHRRSAETQAAHCFVSGRVQGVGFRYHVREAARRHNVSGDVRNLTDGRVEVRATGGNLDGFLVKVREGPAGSQVEKVESIALDPIPCFEGFEIRF